MAEDSRPSLDESLRFAIANKRLVQLGYHGRLRIAEPHDYGIQNGKTMLLVYQLADSGGRAKAATGWRMLEVSQIETLTVLEPTFPGSRGQSHQAHYTWDTLYARVT